MQEHRATSSNTFRERMTIRALNSLERATNFSEMTAVRKFMAGTAIVGSMFGSGITAALAENISENQSEAMSRTAHIDVRFSPKSTSGNDSALVVMAGFSNFNSNILADSVGESVQSVTDGEVWGMSYNNAHLDYVAMADMLEENVNARQLTELQLYGHSAGGGIELMVAEELQARGVYVSAIYMNSTPNGIGGLRPNKQHEIRTYASAIADAPWLSYSDAARTAGEYLDRIDNFKTYEGAIDTITGVHDLVQNEYTPKTWLLIDQLVAIEQTNAEIRLARLSENAKPGEKPVIIYLGTGEGGYDDFVDDKKSGEEICGYAMNVGLPCLRYEIPGAVHMRPEETKEAHAEVLAQASSEIRAAIRGDERDKT